jgi:alpha-beta hydrolase superfamily lysophospholipase
MITTSFSFKTRDDSKIHVYKWSPVDSPKGMILVIHGLADHARRYEEFAEKSTEAGYVVYGPDLRGHGMTAANASNLGVLEPNGWELIIDDLLLLTERIKKEYPKLALFMFGHSLGAEFTQSYMIRSGSELKAVVLSAPQSQQPLSIRLLGEFLGKNEMKRLGPLAPSKIFRSLAWEKFNKPFKPEETDFDWISTDSTSVKLYMDDSLCGWIPSTTFATEITRGFKTISKKSNREMIPHTLPILVLCGTRDATNSFGKNVKTLIRKFKVIGKNIESKFYLEKRHDLLHEVNRQEVTNDIINWFDTHL